MNREQYRSFTICKYHLVKDVEKQLGGDGVEVHGLHAGVWLQGDHDALVRQLQQRHSHIEERRLRDDLCVWA